MGFPAAPFRRYIASRQLIAGDDMNAINDAFYSFQPLTALGTTQADAALVNASNLEVLAGSANNAGIKLPPAYPGAEILVLNNSANTTKVYGTGTDTVQTTGTTYAAAATGVTMATLVSAKFRCIKKGFWQRIVTG